MNEVVHYFGYGTIRDPKVIAAILGKSQIALHCIPAILEGYDLAVQRLDQVPDIVSQKAPSHISPRDLLNKSWSEDFTSYVIKPNLKGRVAGVIWEMTPDEFERMRAWELIDYGWYEDSQGVAKTTDGQLIPVRFHSLGARQAVDRIVNGLDYETWLGRPKEFIKIAERARLKFDKRMTRASKKAHLNGQGKS